MGSVILTDERKAEVLTTLAEAGLGWFLPEPGFRFRDSEADECIVIGWGGYRAAEPLGNLTIYPSEKSGTPQMVEALYTLDFKPATLVGAYLYKGEHHLMSIPDMDNLERCSPVVQRVVHG